MFPFTTLPAGVPSRLNRHNGEKLSLKSYQLSKSQTVFFLETQDFPQDKEAPHVNHGNNKNLI